MGAKNGKEQSYLEFVPLAEQWHQSWDTLSEHPVLLQWESSPKSDMDILTWEGPLDIPPIESKMKIEKQNNKQFQYVV